MYDLRLQTPFTYVAAGASQSGKTTHVFNLLRNIDNIFTSRPSNIIYYFNQWHSSFNSFADENIVSEWIGKLPTVEEIKEKTDGCKNGEGSIVIIDDFAQHLNEDIADLFTVICHSNNVNIFLLTQNIFQKNPGILQLMFHK